MKNEYPKTKKVLKYSLIGCGTTIVLFLMIIVWIVASLFSGPDVMELNAYHPFRSDNAKEQYLNHYDSRSKQWPVASHTRMVETSYGKTFVRISGSDSAQQNNGLKLIRIHLY